MPTIEDNERHWGEEYAWPHEGDEWSRAWGGPDAQWYGTILPRIQRFLPAHTGLEIAPGYGRWTQYLRDECTRLIGVDVSERCIRACRQRFPDDPGVEFYVNDGKSLAVAEDRSVDFAFSFDSLVHVEADVIYAYLCELGTKLSPDGVGFFHHSNIGQYQRRWAAKSRLIPARVSERLSRTGLIASDNSRAFSVSAEVFEQLCWDAGLVCISQERINWNGRLLIDCLSAFALRGSKWDQPKRILSNRKFMREADLASRRAAIYG